MKQLYAVLIALLVSVTVGFGQSLTQSGFSGVIVPQYMSAKAASSMSTDRLPVIFRAAVTGLTANTTYRYYTQGTTNSTTGGGSVDFGGTNSGAGNPLLINASTSTYTFTSNPSVSNAGTYETFTTNASGNYTGWFGFAVTTNGRFTAGNTIYPSITIASTAGSILFRRALDIGIKVITFSTSAGANNGTGITGTAEPTRTVGAFPKDLVALFDATTPSASPLSIAVLESIGVTQTNTPTYYSTATGRWTTIIPNTNGNGVRAIQGLKLSDGSQASLNTDADGIWLSGANTVNPTGGNTTPVIITSVDATLPVTYLNFTARYATNQVAVSWATATEQDNAYFDIERSADAQTFTAIGRRTGKGMSDARQQYNFTDEAPLPGWNYYRLKQVDNTGTFAVSRPVAVLNEGSLAGTALRLFPNPASGEVSLQLDGNAPIQAVRISNMAGQWLSLPTTGNTMNAAGLPGGIYIIEVQTQDGRSLRQRFVKE